MVVAYSDVGDVDQAADDPRFNFGFVGEFLGGRAAVAQATMTHEPPTSSHAVIAYGAGVVIADSHSDDCLTQFRCPVVEQLGSRIAVAVRAGARLIGAGDNGFTPTV